MQSVIFICGLMILATVVMYATKHLHNVDANMSSSLDDNKRIGELTDEAMKRYPNQPMINAIQYYLWDLEERVEALRASARGTDVVYAIESNMKDCAILRKEMERLINQEIEFNSHFNVRTSAQA
jgi:hypothetical protein